TQARRGASGTATRCQRAGARAGSGNKGQGTRAAPLPQEKAMSIRKYGRYLAVYDRATLVCICLDKKEALEVVRRLAGAVRLSPRSCHMGASNGLSFPPRIFVMSAYGIFFALAFDCW